MERVILAVTPGQVTAAGKWGRPLAHMCYRVGGGPHLFRANAPAAPRGGWMVIDDARFTGGGEAESFCNEVLRECAARRFSGVLCRFQGKPVPLLGEAAARLAESCRSRGIAVCVTEGYGSDAPGALVVIPTALSGGTLRGRLGDAVERFGPERVAVWVERAAEDFLLPSPSGAGTPLTAEELARRREEQGANVFFSGELCAHYFTYMAGERGHFVLFDDAGSIRKKLAMAAELGIKTAFLPYGAAEDVVGEVLA